MNGNGRLAVWISLVLLWRAAAGSLAAPVVTVFSPVAGAPGVQVRLTGAGFSSATQVQFDTALADFIVLSDSQMIAMVPAAAITGRIRVTNPSGAGSSSSDFTVAPRITGFWPLRSATNNAITIDGFNFNGTTNVQFHGSNAAFTVTAPTQIRAVVPFGATNGPIRVRTPVGAAVAEQDFKVTGPGPIIDDFSPRFAAPGGQIIIHGVNFTNVTAVQFNGVAATTFSAPAQTQLYVTVPSGATSGRITVTTAAGSGTSTNNFVVTSAPVITDFFPDRGKAGQTTVTIEGVNFAGVIGVGFNGQPVAGISTPAPNQILVTVPNGATTGPITVTNASGVGASASPFVVTTAPIVDTFEPWLGGPGTTVLITGENFTGVTAVRFNGVPSGHFPSPAPTLIYADVPAGATAGPITVVNASGSFVTSSNFVVVPPWPFLTRIDPNVGPRGTEVNLYGVNFGATPVVRFNGMTDPTAYVSGQVGNEYRITAAVPAAATTGPITVTTAAGTSTNANSFFVPPRLTGFSPTNGVPGDEVVLTGTNFTGATAVWFHQGSAPFTNNHSGRITATVPTNAVTGPITVVTPAGIITSTNKFQVMPWIAGFAPVQGPTGTVVTVFGASLDGTMGVSFNGVGAAFTYISSTEVRATVPTNATTGPVQVQTTNGVTVSAKAFVVTGQSDVKVGNVVWPTLAQPGDPAFYSVSFSNAGPWTVSGVTVTGELPAQLNVTAVTNSQGSCTQSNGWLACAAGILTNGARVTIAVTGRFQSEGIAVFAPAITSNEADLNPHNNSAQLSTLVVSNSSRTLSIARGRGGSNVVVSWPVSPVGYYLVASTNLAQPHTWLTVTNMPAVIGGRNTVTNTVLGRARFYRLNPPQP